MEPEELGDFIEVVRRPDSAKPLRIISKRRVYDSPIVLGSGNYGSVYKYFARDTGQAVVVKVFRNLVNADTDCVSTGQLVSPKCMTNPRNNVLDQRCLDNILIMKEMDGDLIDFFEESVATMRVAISCINQLASGLACVEQARGWYTDVKPENILWKREKRCPYFCLGDLDFCKPNRAITTFAPPEGHHNACSEGGSIFGFGLLVMWIMHTVNPDRHPDPYPLHWKHHQKSHVTTSKSIIRKYKVIINGYPLTKKSRLLLQRMVDFRPRMRPGIKEIHKEGIRLSRRCKPN